MEPNLRVSRIRQERRRSLKALVLVAPALLFILAGFIVPSALTLYKGVENNEFSRALPRANNAIRQ